MDPSLPSKPHRSSVGLQSQPIVPPPTTPLWRPAARTVYSDRFIPSRKSSNFALYELSPPTPSGGRFGVAYESLLRSVLFGEYCSGVRSGGSSASSSPSTSTPYSPSPSRNIFRFKSEVPRRSLHFCEDAVCGASRRLPKASRKVHPSPFKVLDAPLLQDDFYTNVVDWSAQNVVAVGLGTCVYMLNASTSKVTMLCDLGMYNSVSSVSWTRRGTYVAVGTNSGEVLIWDASQCQKVRTMKGQSQHVGALSWSSQLLSSGGRDGVILNHDIRSQDDAISKLVGHKSQVCGLTWSPDNKKLASGGNDNRLLVWDQNSTQPVFKCSEHTAAVKAIAWSPHSHGLLASGGGTADRCIRFWNTNTNSQLSCVDSGSQVCNLAWSKNVNELVSTHGYSENQIIIWSYPSMSKVATLTGHINRVLYLASSPDGQTIVTGAGDETLRFWNVFPSLKSQSTNKHDSFASLGRCYIR